MKYSCFGNSNENNKILFHSAFGRNKTKVGKSISWNTLTSRLKQWEEAAKIEQFKNAVIR